MRWYGRLEVMQTQIPSDDVPSRVPIPYIACMYSLYRLYV